jgi:hypothetical protein
VPNNIPAGANNRVDATDSSFGLTITQGLRGSGNANPLDGLFSDFWRTGLGQ